MHQLSTLLGHRMYRALCVLGWATVLMCWAGISRAETLGRFDGDLILKALPNGRDMELVRPFNYIDSRGISWPVPSGTRVDGASIPSVFWSIIGAPYTGRYREASVIHDHYCVTKSRHWKAVHKVFLEGMLARGVDNIQAKLMYLAVYRFGPRWDFDVDACFCKGCPACANPIFKRVPKYQSPYKASEFEELRSKVIENKLSLEELEDAADYQMNTEIMKTR